MDCSPDTRRGQGKNGDGWRFDQGGRRWFRADRPGVYCGSMGGENVRTLATEDLDEPWGIGLITATPDLDMDADVDPLDLSIFLQHWLDGQVSWTTGWSAGRDLNADGAVNLRDFSKFALSWGH